MPEKEQSLQETAGNLAVLTPEEFINDTTREASCAKNRIWVQTMELGYGPETQQVLELLRQGSKRQLDTRLQIDAWALHTTDGSINAIHPLYSEEKREIFDEAKQLKKDVLSNLISHGVHITVTNPMTGRQKFYPFKGRDHRKFFIIDDTVWFGGINLHDDNLQADDFVVKFTNPAITRHLISLYQKVNDSKPRTDEEIVMTEENDLTLLVDRGTPLTSIIFDRGIEMIKQAETSIRFTSQFVPDNNLLAQLHKAHLRGVSVEVLNPPRDEIRGLFAYSYRVHEALMRKKKKIIPRKFTPEFVHAKLLLIDEENPKTQQAMFGSHNLSRNGVRLGTAEAAIHTTNPTLIANLSEFYSMLSEKSTA